MLDLKALNIALEQLETERKIPREAIIGAIEQALSAAYKKDYGKRGQIIRATFNLDTGTTEYAQVKIVVDESMVRMDPDGDQDNEAVSTDTHARPVSIGTGEEKDAEEQLPRFNPEHHILLEDAKKMKKDVVLGEELIFPLEVQDDFGRIAAQTAKQVIIQRIREAEREAVREEFSEKEGDIVSGIIQKIERGMIYLDLGRTVGLLPYEEQIPGERYSRGQRLKAYLYKVEEGMRGISLRLSRTHPQFLRKLFELESPEVASGVVEIKSIAREPGSRSKIAVFSNDENIDPIGACVGQKGIRVSTVMSELAGEKIDIIEWDDDLRKFVSAALSPARVLDIELNEEEKTAGIEVAADQLSLAIGKGGQNVRLAVKLTGYKININGVAPEEVADEDAEAQKPEEEEKETVEEKVEETKPIEEN